MADWCRQRGVKVWAYCLIPNHVHLIAVPQSEDGLARAVAEAHRRYTRQVNFREKWRGFLNSAVREEKLRDMREHGRTGTR
jgi:putative transposase